MAAAESDRTGSGARVRCRERGLHRRRQAAASGSEGRRVGPDSSRPRPAVGVAGDLIHRQRQVVLGPSLE